MAVCESFCLTNAVSVLFYFETVDTVRRIIHSDTTSSLMSVRDGTVRVLLSWCREKDSCVSNKTTGGSYSLKSGPASQQLSGNTTAVR